MIAAVLMGLMITLTLIVISGYGEKLNTNSGMNLKEVSGCKTSV